MGSLERTIDAATNRRKHGFFGSMFSVHGRASRRAFIAHSVLSFVLLVVVIGVVAIANRGNIQQGAALNFLIGLVLLSFANQISITARRLHDIGVHALVSVFIFFPGVNAFFLLALVLIPGTKGTNSYGIRDGTTADELLAQGERYTSKGNWKWAFMCYAGIVENDDYDPAAQDLAIARIAQLQAHLESLGVRRF